MEFRQLTLPISWSFSCRATDFVVSDCNRYAFEWLSQWPFKIKENFVCLVGEKGSGKTHLSKIWASRFSAEFINGTNEIFNKWLELSSENYNQKYFVLDGADKIEDDILLFYIYNTVKEKNAYLLLTSETAPSKWDIKLPDVRSRISTLNIINIQKPDDAAICSIIEKMLLQRGILSKENVVSYIANSIERSYESINYWVNRIDKNIDKNTKLSLQVVKEIGIKP